MGLPGRRPMARALPLLLQPDALQAGCERPASGEGVGEVWASCKRPQGCSRLSRCLCLYLCAGEVSTMFVGCR